jgi:hypothetical protein
MPHEFMAWRVALVDSCGSRPEAVDAALIDAAAFVTDGQQVERRPTAADPTGHGSRIAEVLAGRRSRGRSIELLLGQVFTSSGPTSGAAVAAAIDWAVARRAGLIHLSLGLSSDRAVLGTAVQRALDAGCILVAAVPARGALVYPAAYPGVIRATGDARCVPGEWSCLGPWFFGGCPRIESLDVSGPGGVAGGASIGAAWVTRSILDEPAGATARDLAVTLTARAKYTGPERRGSAAHQNL